jgi:hypothetical protein
MAIRNDFAPGEVLAAADLNDTFGSKLNIAGGKILQIVRATDGTLRSTTSTSFVDVTGMSVTITPQKSDSAVIIAAIFVSVSDLISAAQARGEFRITDSSNNAISGAQTVSVSGVSISQIYMPVNMWAYDTPATVSAVTYKLRFRSLASTATTAADNGNNTGQMYAIEVSA